MENLFETVVELRKIRRVRSSCHNCQKRWIYVKEGQSEDDCL